MTTPPQTQFNPLAGLAAAIFPGAGHLVLGRPKRAILACVGVMGLFLFGLLIGGINTIDSSQPYPSKIWFLGESLVGVPTLVVDQINQRSFKAYDLDSGALRNGYPNEHRVVENSRPVWKPLTQPQMDQGMGPPMVPALGRLHEIAMLSVVLGGMLNLIVFLDALMPSPERVLNKSKSKAGGA